MNENFVLVLTDDGAVHTISISTGRATAPLLLPAMHPFRPGAA
jgi:hypothetical protein